MISCYVAKVKFCFIFGKITILLPFTQEIGGFFAGNEDGAEASDPTLGGVVEKGL